MSAKQYIRKVMAMRKRLNADGLNKRDAEITEYAMRKVSAWMEFWNPTEDQVRNYLRMQRQLIEWIMPGEGSAARAKLMRELDELCA